MARSINRLSARTVAAEARRGLHPDGGGLYLQVSQYGTKSWIFRFTLHGRSREKGLGSVRDVSLADARIAAMESRKLLREGTDPIEARNAERSRRRVEAAKAMNFRACAEAYISAHGSAWRNAKHASQWRNTLRTYAFPVFCDLPVQAVDTAMVMRVLDPIWRTKTETASRVRGRIEAILDWAAVHGYRQRDNPARWKGHLDKLLPGRSKVHKVNHHAALPYDEMGEFMASLRAQDGTAARALEFLILTASRTNETIGAQWVEFDLDATIWTIPAERMKAGKDHRVPLSAPAHAIIQEMKTNPNCEGSNTVVFPGGKRGKPLSNMALLALLRRMRRTDLTVHGFRSSFRDWAAERTNYPREVAEMALAHSVSNKVEAAYRRGDLFDKRRRLMDEWARYCFTPKAGGKVVSMTARAQ